MDIIKWDWEIVEGYKVFWRALLKYENNSKCQIIYFETINGHKTEDTETSRAIEIEIITLPNYIQNKLREVFEKLKFNEYKLDVYSLPTEELSKEEFKNFVNIINDLFEDTLKD